MTSNIVSEIVSVMSSGMVKNIIHTTPGQVQNPIAQPGVADNTLDISWDALVSTPATLSYTIEYKEASSGIWLSLAPILVPTIIGTIPALSGGTLYDIRIFATNNGGDGLPSSVVQATPNGV